MRLSYPVVALSDGVVQLRPLVEGDADAVAAIRGDAQIARWTPVNDRMTHADALESIERSRYCWEQGIDARFGVASPGGLELLGEVGVSPMWDHAVGEVYYWVAPGFRGAGVATRATALVSRWSFEVLALERLEIFVHPDNHASLAVAQRVGYTREGLLRSHRRLRGQRVDSVVLSLLPSDWRPA